MHSKHAQCCLPRCFGPDPCETLKAGQAWPKQVCVPWSEGLQISKGMYLQDAVEQAAVLLPEQQQILLAAPHTRRLAGWDGSV